MANEDQDLEKDIEGEEGPAAGSGSKKMLIIIIVAVLLAAGGGAFFLLSGDPPAETDENGEQVVEEKKVDKGPAEYVGVPESITSNLPGKEKNRTVQIKMSFVVRSEDAREAVRTHMPRLKNDVLMLVSQQSADELLTPEGRTLLQQKSLQTVQATLTDLVGKPTIEKVLFISFVMQ